MDPIRNPYTPGAGTPPSELAGRDELRKQVTSPLSEFGSGGPRSKALLRLSRNARSADLARRALRGLAGFTSALTVTYQDIEVGLDFDPELGLAEVLRGTTV